MSSDDDEAVLRKARSRVGRVFHKTWRFEQLLGGGSTACVFVARDEGAGTGPKRAAAKVLHPHWAEVPEVRTRFLREGKAANAVSHRGIVHVFGEGMLEDGVPFLLMELLEGESLEQRWIRKQFRLPVKEVLWVADQILSVLGAAHAKGIVHRDVKPDNVFVTRDRVIKLIDFGIAHVAEAANDTDEHTRVGTLLGTPAFLPPEQARGELGIGVTTDLWAVGATMFTLLSGHYVHEEERVIDQLIAATSKPAPSLATVAPHVPRNIIHLVDCALRFDAETRWPNASSMRHAIKVAYTEWAHAPMPNTNDDSLMEDVGVQFLNAPSAPPPSVMYPQKPRG